MATKKKPEDGGLKKKVQDAAKVMKTSKKDHKVVMDIANEIIKRGRTDKKAAHQEVDKAPSALQKESRLRRRKMIKENDEMPPEDEIADEELPEEDFDPEAEGELDGEMPEEGTDPEMDLENDSDLEPEFDIENDMSDYETPEGDEDISDSDDIDDVISQLLATENIEIDVDAEKGTVKVTDTAKDKDDKGVGKVKGDVELIADEPVEGQDDLGEDFNADDDLDLEMEDDFESALEDEKVVKEQLEEMLGKFSKTYPKVFNENFTNKLSLIIEMYTKAKAKTIATESVRKVVKSVDVYMEKVEETFKKENAKKLAEAVDNRKKEKLLESVKSLLESKLGKVDAPKDVEKLDEAVMILYKDNKKLKGVNAKLKENLFNMKTNFIFEQKTKNCTPQQKSAISRLLEGFDYTTTKEFSSKLASAISIVSEQKTKEKKQKLQESRKHKIRTRQKPIRRSDKVLTVESVKDAVRRKITKKGVITENRDDERTEIPMDDYEKHIYG